MTLEATPNTAVAVEAEERIQQALPVEVPSLAQEEVEVGVTITKAPQALAVPGAVMP
jgi:hypothetical protein